MNKMMVRALGVSAAFAVATAAFGQADWGIICVDPENTMPRTNPYIVNRVFNSLIHVGMGLQGSVTYGGANGPCFNPAETIPIPGNFLISIGNQGSIQKSSPSFEDSGMAVTFGAISDPVWCYATTTKNGARTKWGSGGFSEFFVGFSNRYMSATSTNDNVRAKLQVEVVADAARFRWQMTNLDTEAAGIGLWFGSALAMLTDSGSGYTGAIASGFFGQKPLYIYLPNQRPPNTDISFNKNLNPANFPSYVDFLFGQTDAYGIRIENEPSAATGDIPANQPATADQFWLGKTTFLLGDISSPSATFPVAMLPDTPFRGSPAFVQAFPEQQVEGGQTIQILHYVRSTWGSSNYQLPYGVVVDAPKLLGTPAVDLNGNPNQGGIVPNPFRVRIYVDNVGGFGFDGREFPLNDVRVKLKFQPNDQMTITGATASVPYELERTIPLVQPRDDEFLDFTVTAGPDISGIVPYTVEVFSQPGNVRKTINGTITIAARARMNLVEDANFVTFPYQFTETALETILANFLDPAVPGGDFQAYKWDPIQQGYVITNSVERGKSMWIIYSNTAGTNTIANLAGNPQMPGSLLDGAPLVQGRGGFNMVGNPYNYDIPINQILGVSAADPSTSKTFREMVELGYVQSFLTRWDPFTKDYVFVDSDTGVLEPLKGYWVRVLTDDDLTFNYPPVFGEHVPEQTRKPVAWKQTASQWKLKLSARTKDGGDAENHVGQAANAAQARRYRIFEPPVAPTQTVSLAIDGALNGKPAKMAQTLSETKGRHSWNVVVDSKTAGDVTITWPNLSTLPKNIRLRITDKATNVSRFLRQASGYTFRMDQPGRREFTLTSETSAISGMSISNVVASQPTAKAVGRGAAPFTIAYTLSAEATTSVRILSAAGKEVFTVHQGRADTAGEHKLVWNLRTNSNRAVAPGAYRVEIVAESPEGERIRKIVPINVVR